MSWFFVFYVDSRYGYVYREPDPWFNVPLITGNCPDTKFHLSETHHLHRIGGHLKNFGLRTALILETKQETEAVMLKLLLDEIIVNNNGSRSRPPILQLILQDPDFKKLSELCSPLEEIRKGEQKRRHDQKASAMVQKNIERLVMTVEEFDGSFSEEFLQSAETFIGSCNDEIERIRVESRTLSRKAATARRKLQRELLSYATFTHHPDLK